jgi:succinate-acetate transporter protein
VLSCYDAAIWGIQIDSPPNVVTGLLVFYGGMTLGLAGMWEYASARNTHGGVGFVSVGAFFVAYAAIGLLPGFGVLQAYEPAHIKNIDPAIGIFLLGWAIFAVIFWLGTIRSSNVVLSGVFLFFMLAVLLACIAEFKQGDHIGLKCKRASGFFGLVASLLAFYLGLAKLLTEENSYFTLPTGEFNKPKH